MTRTPKPELSVRQLRPFHLANEAKNNLLPPRPARGIAEHERIQGLILGGGGDMFRVSQMIAERHNFCPAQNLRMLPAARPVAMEYQITPRPLDLSFLRTPGNLSRLGSGERNSTEGRSPSGVNERERVNQLFGPQDPAQLVEQLGFGVGADERSLCRERFRGHNGGKRQQNRRKRNQNLTVAGRCYAALWPPNIC